MEGSSDAADWWLAMDGPSGLQYYDVNGSWLPGLSVTYQGPLINLTTPIELLLTGLPAGTYTFYFGVDTNMNGSIDTGAGQFYYDSVRVNIVKDTGGVGCTKYDIWMCFDETIYQTPEQTTSPTGSLCKSWSTSGFTCSGSFYISVYPPVGKTPIQFTFSTTCSGAQVITLTGAEIESLLKTASSTMLQELSADEIMEGKIPIMLRATFSGGGSGTASIDAYCQ